MIIAFRPQYSHGTISVARFGDVLDLNGETYDFGPLPSGSTLPNAAIDCPYIVGDVERDEDGVLHVTLLLPIQRAVFHDTIPEIIDPPNGVIDLPVIAEDTQ